MDNPLQILMTGLIDYQGLFAPAGPGMREAVRNYAEWRRGLYGYWLGRFVVPVYRLGEFEEAVEGLRPELENPWDGWRLSVITGENLAGDLKTVAAFNKKYQVETWGGPDLIDTVEIKAGSAEEIRSAMERVPGALMPYFDITGEDPAPLVSAIGQTGGRAKVRADGEARHFHLLARFLDCCASCKVAFKVTDGRRPPPAGLGPDGDAPLMHGFFNLFLAAVFAREGMGPADTTGLIGEASRDAIGFDGYGVSWRGRRINLLQLHAGRQRFAIAFGSNEFEEHIEEMQKTGLLLTPAI